ncbi:hypothetical protein [Saccharomonospora piscinae]|uniref:hypothetical protein n=1 Tax=Saccharomonospora piscinae TaxID=687388 RepID=UPI0012DBEB1C|nr:hypothetical protein [Saccharomonospora piscinae]
MIWYLRRQGHDVAFCTVDRIMRERDSMASCGARKQRTTIPAKDGIRTGDKLGPDFTACAPDHVWGAGLYLPVNPHRVGLRCVRHRRLFPRDRWLNHLSRDDHRVGVQDTQHGRLAP